MSWFFLDDASAGDLSRYLPQREPLWCIGPSQADQERMLEMQRTRLMARPPKPRIRVKAGSAPCKPATIVPKSVEVRALADMSDAEIDEMLGPCPPSS